MTTMELRNASETTLISETAWTAAEEAYNLKQQGMSATDIRMIVSQKKTVVYEWLKAVKLSLEIESKIPNNRSLVGVHKMGEIVFHWRHMPDSIKKTKTVFDFFLECVDSTPKKVSEEWTGQD